MSGGHVRFTRFYNFRTSKDSEILRQSSYMSHILKGLSKKNTHIPRIVLFDEEKWQKMCSNAYFEVFPGGGHFWRVTLKRNKYMSKRKCFFNMHETCVIFLMLSDLAQNRIRELFD